jgi:hypothetical protein
MARRRASGGDDFVLGVLAVVALAAVAGLFWLLANPSWLIVGLLAAVGALVLGWWASELPLTRVDSSFPYLIAGAYFVGTLLAFGAAWWAAILVLALALPAGWLAHSRPETYGSGDAELPAHLSSLESVTELTPSSVGWVPTDSDSGPAASEDHGPRAVGQPGQDPRKPLAEWRDRTVWDSTDELLLEIARCPEAVRCLSGAEHPCRQIVLSQSLPEEAFLVPEPWSGALETAPILFVSSNPSNGAPPNPELPPVLPPQPRGLDEGSYPRMHWPDADVIELFNHRFSGGRREWIKDGTRELRADGSYGRPVAFWGAVRARAEELLQRKPIPGVDYALTEVVHCKSQREYGVKGALTTCADRYLKRVLAASGARVIVVLGETARSAVEKELGLPRGVTVSDPLELGEQTRLVAFLPHPNAFKAKTFATVLANEELLLLQQALRRPRTRGSNYD